MKQSILSIVFLLAIAFSYGQTSSASRYKGAWKTYDLDKQEGDSTARAGVYRTSDVAIYRGDKHPVYLSKRGKLFIWVVSRETGNTYRKYIN